MSTEGIIKFQADHVRTALDYGDLGPARRALLLWRNVMVRLGMVGADPQRYGGLGFGNLSVRLPPFTGAPGRRRFLVTGTQTAGLSRLTVDELCVIEEYHHARVWVRSQGMTLPSSESMTHAVVYDLDERIRAVVHAHCPVLWKAAAALGLPTTGKHADYGTPEMVEEVQRLHRSTDVMQRRILCMGGHQDGMVAFGANLDEAGTVLVSALERALDLPG